MVRDSAVSSLGARVDLTIRRNPPPTDVLRLRHAPASTTGQAVRGGFAVRVGILPKQSAAVLARCMALAFRIAVVAENVSPAVFLLSENEHAIRAAACSPLSRRERVLRQRHVRVRGRAIMSRGATVKRTIKRMLIHSAPRTTEALPHPCPRIRSVRPLRKLRRI